MKRHILPYIAALVSIGCDETPSAPDYAAVSIVASVSPLAAGEEALLAIEVVNRGETIHYYPNVCDSLRSGIAYRLISPLGAEMYRESSRAREHCTVTLAALQAKPQAVLSRWVWLYGSVFDIDDQSAPMIPGTWQAIVSFSFSDTARDRPNQYHQRTIAFEWPPPQSITLESRVSAAAPCLQ